MNPDLPTCSWKLRYLQSDIGKSWPGITSALRTMRLGRFLRAVIDSSGLAGR